MEMIQMSDPYIKSDKKMVKTYEMCGNCPYFILQGKYDGYCKCDNHGTDISELGCNEYDMKYLLEKFNRE